MIPIKGVQILRNRPLNYIRKYHRLKKQSKLNSNIPEVDFDTKFTNMNLTSYLNMNSSATQRVKNKNVAFIDFNWIFIT